MIEVVYLRDDGTIVRSYAYYSSRSGTSRLMVGDTPVDEINGKILYQGAPQTTEQFDHLVGVSRGELS